MEHLTEKKYAVCSQMLNAQLYIYIYQCTWYAFLSFIYIVNIAHGNIRNIISINSLCGKYVLITQVAFRKLHVTKLTLKFNTFEHSSTSGR